MNYQGRELPPQNIDAEKSLLGSILLDENAADEVADILTPESFYVYQHGMIYRVLKKMRDKSERIDSVTVAQNLAQDQEAAGEIENIPETLVSLLETVPHSKHARYYAGIVQEQYFRRNMLMTSVRIHEVARDPVSDIDECLAEAEGQVHTMIEARMGQSTEDVDIGKVLMESCDNLGAARQRGVTTGFVELDEMTLGWQPGHLIVIAARPSAGKTAMACNLAVAAAKSGAMVGFVSLEQSRLELGERFLAAEARVSGHGIKSGDLTEPEKNALMEACNTISNIPLWIDDEPGRSISAIAARARLWKRKHDLRILLIDYLQIIRPDDERMKREQQVATMTRRLFTLARELKISVIALAQMNRDIGSRTDKRPRLSDIRESGAIEQDANIVCFVHRPWVFDPQCSPAEAKLIVAKQRDGSVGDIKLEYQPQFVRFQDLAQAGGPHEQRFEF